MVGFLLVAITTTSTIFRTPKASAQLGLISGGICTIYAATIEKVVDKAKDFLKKKAEETAKKKAGEIVGTIGKAVTDLGEGDKVPVLDSALKEAVDKAKTGIQQTERNINCKERVERILVAELKRRVLDVIIDQITAFIQGGDTPRFVTDFGGFIEEAGRAAVGDVALELGLGELCTGISPPSIQAQLEVPAFSQRVSCTLDDIVGNIQRFTNNFTSGGFIGYQELLKPHNNVWGVEILTQAEFERRAAQKQDALRQEITVGSGFLSTTRCLAWTPFKKSNGRLIEGDPVSVNESFNYPDPKKPPPTSEEIQAWKCDQIQITTPGAFIAGLAGKAVTAQADYVINAQTLQEYLAVIIDSLLNRIVKQGFKGILGVPVSAPPTGYRSSADVPATLQELGTVYRQTTLGEIVGSSKENMLSEINNASTTLTSLEEDLGQAVSINKEIEKVISDFILWCKSGTNKTDHPETCSQNNEDTLTIVTKRTETIENLLVKTTEHKTLASQLTAQVEAASDNTLNDLIKPILDFIQSVVKLAEESNSILGLNLENSLANLQSIFTACQTAPPHDPSCP